MNIAPAKIAIPPTVIGSIKLKDEAASAWFSTRMIGSTVLLISTSVIGKLR
jgi:hypothetical protein